MSTDMPAGYTLRRPRPDEVGVVTRLASLSDEALGTAPSLNDDLIKLFWSRPRFSLEQDAWFAERDGDVVGYAEIWDMDETRFSSYALVDPSHTGRGLGSALAGLIEQRARAVAVEHDRLDNGINTADEVAARLLEGRGYSWARRFWHMEIELADGYPPMDAVPGIDVRGFDPSADLPAAHAILEEAFSDHWGFHPMTYEQFLEQSVTSEDYDPGLWHIATDKVEPVAVLSASAQESRGWVNDLGVRTSHRGKGIAKALLVRSFDSFRERGLPRVRLNVDSDNETGAVSLYERVGMHPVSSYDLWSLTLR